MKNELINYSDILDIMNEGLIFIDEEGIIKQYSEKAKDVFGINRFYSI